MDNIVEEALLKLKKDLTSEVLSAYLKRKPAPIEVVQSKIQWSAPHNSLIFYYQNIPLGLVSINWKFNGAEFDKNNVTINLDFNPLDQ